MSRSKQTSDKIESRFLDSRDFFALRYQQGLIPLEVDEYEDTKYEEFTNLEDIEGGTSLNNGFQRIEDTNSDDLLFVPSDDEDVVMHVGLGIAPSLIEAYVSYPEGTRNMGSIPDLSTTPTPGNNIGGFNGDDSPYNSPTVISEMVIPPKQHIEMNFYNPGDDSHEPMLRFVYRKYRVRTLDVSNSQDRNAISRIVKPGSPAPIFPVGNFDRKADYNMNQEWGISPMTRSELERRIGGGR